MLPPATRGVRLTLSMGPERLLLSDFEAWHCVLNGWFLSLDDEEDAAGNARLPIGPSDLGALQPALNAEMHRSWERIFDLPLIARSGWSNGDDQRIQGVCEQILLSDVVRVELFVAR
jgi:hypothetical protein